MKTPKKVSKRLVKVFQKVFKESVQQSKDRADNVYEVLKNINTMGIDAHINKLKKEYEDKNYFDTYSDMLDKEIYYKNTIPSILVLMGYGLKF